MGTERDKLIGRYIRIKRNGQINILRKRMREKRKQTDNTVRVLGCSEHCMSHSYIQENSTNCGLWAMYKNEEIVSLSWPLVVL